MINKQRLTVWIFLPLLLSSCISSLTKEKETSFITFEQLAEMPSGTYDMVSLTDGKFLYGVGGVSNEEENSLIKNLFRYSLTQNVWETFSTNSIPKQGASGLVVNHENAIIFNGFVPSRGSQGEMQSNIQVEKLNLQTFKAEVIDHNPMPVYKSGTAFTKDRLYVFGGMLEDGIYSNKHFELNLKNGDWRELSPMPKALLTAGAYVDGKLYVFGGFNGESHDNIFMYSVKSDRWRQLGKMPEPLHYSTIVVHKSKIYMIGEYFSVFDTRTRSLKRVTVNIPSLHHCGAVVIEDKLYVFGGFIVDDVDQKNPNPHLYMADLSLVDDL